MSSERNARLDQLRAVAVVLVVAFHVGLPTGSRPLFSALAAWARIGWIGVDLFFVLSGFLIASLMFSELRGRGAVDVGRFLLRRGLKIWPSFYVFLAVTFLAALTRYSLDARLAITFASEAFYVQNYGPAFWEHTWSLAVEEHFYLLLALLFWGLQSRFQQGRWVFPFALAVIVVCPVVRLWVASSGPFDNQRMTSPTHLRIDSLMVGVLLAYARASWPAHFARLAGQRVTMIAGALALVAPPLLANIGTSPTHVALMPTAIALGAAGLVAWAAAMQARASALGRLVAVVGADSYNIYLWHMPILRWGLPMLHRAGLLEAPGSLRSYVARLAWELVLSIAVGFVVARLLERPVLRLRDRWIPSRAAAPLDTDQVRIAAQEAWPTNAPSNMDVPR